MIIFGECIRKTIKIKREIVKGGKFVGNAGHKTRLVANSQLRMASRKAAKAGKAVHKVSVVAKRKFKVAGNRMAKVEKAGHRTGVVAKRKMRVVGRRLKKMNPI